MAYDHWTLEKAKQRILFETTRLEKRIGRLVEALDKLGMIPVIFGLYVAYSKVFDGESFSDVPYFVLGLFAGAYLAAYCSIHIISKLNTMPHIIGVAEELATQTKEVVKEHNTDINTSIL